jgi:trk system potassium uptake protein TrkA
MFIVVAGGGKVGFYLARALLNEGYEVLVIERDRDRAERLNEELGSVVLLGDASEASVLGDAGVGRADVAVAVTGHDEDNLVICQMAKRKFAVPRTIARINNPKNEQIFRILGIDATVSSTDLILQQIEQRLPGHALVHLRVLREADLDLVEAAVDATSTVVGRAIRQVSLPPDTAILAVIRRGKTTVATIDSRLEGGDRVIALARSDQEAALRTLLQPGSSP